MLEKLIGKKLSLEQLKDRISMIGTDLEKIEGDEIIVEVFPNRPDMLSEHGFARALAAFIGTKSALRMYPVEPSKQKIIIDPSVGKIRPYTAAAIVRNMKLTDPYIKEIMQLQEKLHITFGRHRKKVAIGVYPSEKIRYPITFKALRPETIVFRPLDFPKELNGREILELHPKGKEYGHLLEQLPLYPVFVDATGSVLSMPPIINSHTVGKITQETRDVFVEVSGFDLATCEQCLTIVVTTLADMGGDVQSLVLEYPQKKCTTPVLEAKEMRLDLTYVAARSGLKLSEDEVKKLLSRMGHGYQKGVVCIPSYRADILHPIDIVEDIIIAYGYENIEPQIPAVATIAQEDHFEQFKRKVMHILMGLGYGELFTYHLVDGSAQSTKMNNQSIVPHIVQIVDPVSTEYNTLRAWMLPSIMHVLSENKHREFPQKIFDAGVCFLKETAKGMSETGVLEVTRLAAVSCHRDADYTEARQAIERIFDSLGLAYQFEETEHGSFIPGRVARVRVKGRHLAYVGEVHPKVLSSFGLELPVAAFEVNLTELFGCISETKGK